jgi:hypothetical protein
VNAEIFERYVDTVLIPAVEANRQLPGCGKKTAILFCDNCLAHMSNLMLKKLARHGVLVFTHLLHTSHIFQVLDVLLFGLAKNSKKYEICDDTLAIHVDHILRLFRVYEASMASTTIRAAWRQTEFEYENRNITMHLSINEEQIRESRNFRRIWMFDYHENQLSAGPEKQKWGWINEHKFRKKKRIMLRA